MARGVKASLGSFRRAWSHRRGSTPEDIRRSNPVRWGNLRRTDPIDPQWGYGRGTPVDRWLLARFFERHRFDVQGRVLEVASPMYSEEHRPRVERIDILDIDPENRQASIVADLDDAESLPAAAFDCVICTQTLQYVRNVDTALSNLWRSLAPGGVLLLSIPALAKRDPTSAIIDRWRLMPDGLATIVERVCPGAEREVEGMGNALVATAIVFGVSAEELTPEELSAQHSDFPVLSVARVRKPFALAWEHAVNGVRETTPLRTRSGTSAAEAQPAPCP